MRLQMPCIDRFGLLLDVSQALVDLGINIISVEVDNGVLYLEYHTDDNEKKPQVFAALRNVHGIHTINEVPYMPSKERAEQLDAVLASVQDGVLAVDQHMIVKQYNKAAVHLLQLQGIGLGAQLPEDLAEGLLIVRSLTDGEAYRNREVFIERIDSYCVVSTRPLYNDTNNVVGVVVMIRDRQDVQELMQKMTGSMPVTFMDISFVSPVMGEIVEQAQRYSASSSTVLIRGETGTGKELFARALHSASPRARHTFLPVNCATIPETLLESELFGYEGGAFTGAVKGGKPGLFELANGGTLFLDEIGEIPVHLQAKLLRVLQEKRVRRIGSLREVPIDVRLIAATHRDLEEMVERNLFREDLYYRLNVIPLYLPPLRNRVEDIPLLARQFLKRFIVKLDTSARKFTPEALLKLQTYGWPGNVRELENIIERAVNLVDGPEIGPEHILLEKKPVAIKNSSIRFETYQTLEERLGEVERDILQATVQRFGSSRKVGAVLGLSHTAVIRRLKKYGLL